MKKKNIQYTLCSFLVLFMVLGFQSNVQAGTGLPPAPGWAFGKDIKHMKEYKLKIDYADWDMELDNQKIINSWGYMARNVDEIKDLLPGPFYDILKHPEIWGNIRINETAYIPNKGPAWKNFMEATKKFKGEPFLDKDGWLRNYKAGIPFPDVDEKDPQAGLKLIWNYTKRLTGDDRAAKALISLRDRSGNVRSLVHFYDIIKFNGRHMLDPKPLYQPNPLKFDYMYAFPILEPYNLRGMIQIYYRYDDPNKDEDMWAYIPSMRRVRRLSTAQTQDKLPAGMDYTWDTTEQFSGKVNKLNWKLLGIKKVLMPLSGTPELQMDEKGFMCGVDQYYQRRDVYVIQGTYKEPITMSSITIYMDAETLYASYSIGKDLRGNEYLFQYYANTRTKDGSVITTNMNCVDIQRRHSSMGFTPQWRSNAGRPVEYFKMENLLQKYPAK